MSVVQRLSICGALLQQLQQTNTIVIVTIIIGTMNDMCYVTHTVLFA